MASALGHRSEDSSATGASHKLPVIPSRHVDGLCLPELPAGKIDPTRPYDGHLAAIAVDGNRLIANGTEPQSGHKAPLGRLSVARSAHPPVRTGLHLGSIYSEEPYPLRATAERVTVDDVSAWTINYHATSFACSASVRNGSKADIRLPRPPAQSDARLLLQRPARTKRTRMKPVGKSG